MRTITVFNFKGERQEWMEADVQRIYPKECMKVLDQKGMVGMAQGTPLEMVLIRNDDRYFENLAAYIKYKMRQPSVEPVKL